LTRWAGWAVLSSWAGFAGGRWGTLGWCTGWAFLSILARLTGRAVGASWAGWSVTAVLACASWVASGSGCSGLARWTSGSGWSRWAGLAWWCWGLRADLQRWATRNARCARHAGFAWLAVLTGSAWWARETGQAAVVASRLPLGDGSVVRNVSNGNRSKLVDFAHHILGRRLAILHFLGDGILNVLHIVVDHRQRDAY